MDVDLPANCTCFALRKAARAVTQRYDEALKPRGLRATQFSVLSMLASRGPIGMTELATALVTDRTTLTRNLKPLIARGFVETAQGPDRRRRAIALTTRGRDALAEAMPLWRAVQAATVDGLGGGPWAGLMQGLERAIRLPRAE